MVGFRWWVQGLAAACTQGRARGATLARGGWGSPCCRSGRASPSASTCFAPHTQGTPPLCACCLLARSREGHAARRHATCAQEAELGTGSYGKVVHAVDSVSGEHVAIKLLRRGGFVSGVAGR